MSKSYYKYLKYKNKYLELKNKIGGNKDFITRRTENGIIQISRFNENYSKYKDEYDPQFFLDILESNIFNPKITLKDNRDASWDYILNYIQERQGPGAERTSWDNLLKYIRNSCEKLSEKINNNYAEEKSNIKNVVFIPLYTSGTGGTSFSKSNFWFSLLYMKILKEEFNFNFDDVVLIGLQNQNNFYLNNAKSNNIKLNIFTFDDGIYTGNQMKDVLASYLRLCGKKSINKINVVVPFIINKDPFFDPEWENWSNKKFLHMKDTVEKFINLTVKLSKSYRNFYNYHEIDERIDLLEKRFEKSNIDYFNFYKKFKYFRKYYRTLIEYFVGIDNFNINYNHWFDHKIPDKISFKQPYSGKIDYNDFISAYKKKWIVNNEAYQNKLDLTMDINPNELLFNFNNENKNLYLNIQLSYSVYDIECK